MRWIASPWVAVWILGGILAALVALKAYAVRTAVARAAAKRDNVQAELIRRRHEEATSSADGGRLETHADPHLVSTSDSAGIELQRLLQGHMVPYNRPDVVLRAIKTLRKIGQNVLNEPSNTKFHRLKATNAALARTVANVRGASAYLQAMGFAYTIIEFEEYFELNTAEDPQTLHQLQIAMHLLDEAKRQTEAEAARRVSLDRPSATAAATPVLHKKRC